LSICFGASTKRTRGDWHFCHTNDATRRSHLHLAAKPENFKKLGRKPQTQFGSKYRTFMAAFNLRGAFGTSKYFKIK
jgi:hypothetical protein